MSKRLLILSFFLLFIHTIVPHEHYAATKVIIVENNVRFDIFTFLKQVVSSDLGANHLENYATKEFNIKINPAILPNTEFQIAPSDFSVFYEPTTNKPSFIRQHNLYINLHLRAPPAL